MKTMIGGIKADDIHIYDNGWGGPPEGISFGDVEVWLSDAALDALHTVVGILQYERAERREREEALLSNTGPELAGFEQEAV